MRRALATAAGAALLAGCAGNPREIATTGYVAPATCVPSLADVTAAPLAVTDDDTPSRERPRFVKIHETATCVREGDQARPVLLYSLSKVPVPGELSVTVEAAGHMMGGEAAVFAPSVRVLDAQRRTLKRYTLGDFDRRGMVYTLTAFLNDPATRDGYLLIEPDAEQVGRETLQRVGVNQSVTVTTGFLWFTVVNGDEMQRTAIFTDVGRVMVQANAHQPANFDERNRR